MGAAFCVYANLAADRSGFNAFGRKKFQGRGDLGVFSHQIQQQVSFFTGGDFRPENVDFQFKVFDQMVGDGFIVRLGGEIQ